MNQSPKKLIVIGDSSVYGWGDKDGGGWCERLRRNFMNLPNAPIIYPLGIRGDGLENVAKRWQQEWKVRGELRRQVPDGILLSIGLNDTAKVGQPNGRSQLSSEAYGFGLYQLLKEIKINTTLFLIGLTPVDELAMPFADCLWYSNKSCSIYESKIEEVCLELNIPFLPIYNKLTNQKEWRNFIEPDGIHLNSDGHYWIYKQVKTWKPLLDWSGLEETKTLTPIY
tara:strand:- start:401 stop:1075 length:675 start_codon:yes stop_codon:yes gene_type:complete